jgi:hypothetical protein
MTGVRNKKNLRWRRGYEFGAGASKQGRLVVVLSQGPPGAKKSWSGSPANRQPLPPRQRQRVCCEKRDSANEDCDERSDHWRLAAIGSRIVKCFKSIAEPTPGEQAR